MARIALPQILREFLKSSRCWKFMELCWSYWAIESVPWWEPGCSVKCYCYVGPSFKCLQCTLSFDNKLDLKFSSSRKWYLIFFSLVVLVQLLPFFCHVKWKGILQFLGQGPFYTHPEHFLLEFLVKAIVRVNIIHDTSFTSVKGKSDIKYRFRM